MGAAPNYFMCAKARLSANAAYHGGWTTGLHRAHVCTRTGRTKPRGTRLGGPRTLHWKFEYTCTCGHTGWTTNIGVLDIDGPTLTESRNYYHYGVADRG